MKKLDGKKIIITGGSMGIGFAVASECAKAGAQLILVSRHEKDLRDALEKIGNVDNKHSFYALDVGNESAVKVFAEHVKTNFVFIDALVNCAGVYGPIGKIDEVDTKAFCDAININLMGTFYLCHYFIPLLRKSRRAKIVNFSGGGASGPFPNYSAYSVSKTGVVRLTENMAHEYRDELFDINVIAPGFVLTRLHQDTLQAGEKAGEKFLKNTEEQLKNGGVAPEVPAKLAAFLLSGDSDGITGKFISAPWDMWDDEDFRNILRHDSDFATLRRIDNKSFFKK